MAWTRWTEKAQRPSDPAEVALLDALFGNSPYLTETALQNPVFVTDLWRQGPETILAELAGKLRAARAAARDGALPEAIATTLRRLKRRVALAVAVADIAEVWALEKITGALSDFASGCLDALTDSILLQLARDARIDLGSDPEAAAFTVLGMGKLGAGELNYSSDIDLILLYDRDAPAITGNDQMGRHFVRCARLLVQLMSETSADGYIFRTDLRLRPDPGSTPLVMSVQAAELYYESVGQNWERAAMIKAHPVAGNRAVGAAFLADMRPYIWRKHLDFAAIHDIHSIKRQIDAHRGGGTVKVFGHNVKLGRGGIREIEFFAQTQQLIFGGRDPSLRLRGTCETIRALSATGHVTPAAAGELIEAYEFLRRVEHRLQMVDDRQTHSLPADEAGVAAIATFLGYPDSAAFQQALLDRLRCVEGHYAKLFEEAPSLAGPGGNLVFTGTDDDPGTLESLRDMSFRDPSAAAGIVRRWHHGRYRATATARARELLTELMPGLLKELGTTAAPDQALLNFDLFLANLPAGVQLFSLFKANPALLELLATIMGSAPGLAAHLARRTLLLDSVLSPDFYRPLPSAPEMTADLAAVLAKVDHEQDILDLARRWANDRRFQIGVQQLKHIVRPAQAGLAYSDVAAATISALCDRVEQRFADTHGGFRGQRLAVLGLGKLGSREMSATSDLDLIFVYDIPSGLEASDGPQPLSPIQYYTRLSQKIVTALTAHTNEGALYEVDMRLRPSGRAGPLANSLEGFETYHAQSAWTWEHMALTRARVIHGPPGLVDRLADIVKTTLCRPRDAEALVRDVADMRDRIAQHAPAKSAWDFKHLPGGLFDIDFVAQYLALRHAGARPDVLAPHPAEMLRRMADAGMIERGDVERLRATRTLLSDVQSLLRLTLNGDEAAFDETKAPEGQQRLIAATEGASDLPALQARIAAEAEAVRAIYERIVEAPARAAGWTPRREGKGSER
ncbi:bifunctional [glutamine synthetase] adenylyltransferase/[glutamine synthetase]-adenylyl-L-tyrosine phosphorylase [Reyranella sp.]|uniref:bifunctional [glutamine synthetase] adenylyltransferase/[glutamine synthetase]-adenylyl-L-tyrosine phosphorylase n=1 Tax=Reyranella sp. TaxID=1929291 RepID=UPI0025EED2C8|nr:bifunctional [glutamine synthetase] adenylyltransferase/[glutamine synthetase]-adenylyl-L-tyrosine phosphorylase [Reyranella sp.]